MYVLIFPRIVTISTLYILYNILQYTINICQCFLDHTGPIKALYQRHFTEMCGVTYD